VRILKNQYVTAQHGSRMMINYSSLTWM